MFDPEVGRRFKEVQPCLEAVIEKHLPGDFSSWESDNTSWDGDVKTISNSDKDPRSSACAWRIFTAAEAPDEVLTFIDQKSNAEALDELEFGLQQATAALNKLSMHIRTELDHKASERLRASYDPPPEKPASAQFTFLLIEEAMQTGIEAARSRLTEIGDQSTRANRKAAAVVEKCRVVYEARSGRPAPKSTRDITQKDDKSLPPVRFVSFSKDVFGVFSINFTVSHALTLLKFFRNSTTNLTPNF